MKVLNHQLLVLDIIWKFFSQTFQSLEEVFFPGGLLWKSKAFIECSVQDKFICYDCKQVALVNSV